MPCEFCGTLIRCDMYRHVARCHLDLAQLWRCPTVVYCLEGCATGLDGSCSWSPQSAGGGPKHQVRNAHPSLDSDTAGVYGLTSHHSGISNDILLFSDIGLSLAHHYRVQKRGVPHVAFCRNYMSQLRALHGQGILFSISTI